jgi:hypothetical protein
MSFNNGGRRPHKYQEHFDEFEKNGRFSKYTKPVGRPRPNKENVPFDKWDWQAEDPEFYESFMRLPDSKDPQSFEQVKWNRYHQSLAQGDAHMRDFRPRTFIKRMRLEIFVFTSSILIGIFGKLHALRACSPSNLLQEQDDIRQAKAA